MGIERLRIKNFRCFKNLEIELHPKCSVLVGISGAGKSTILDALAIALGGYLTGFDGKALQIQKRIYAKHWWQDQKTLDTQANAVPHMKIYQALIALLHMTII